MKQARKSAAASGSGGEGGARPAFTARSAAVALLRAVTESGRSLADTEAEAEAPGGALAALSGPERASAARLVRAALRHLARADALLAPHLQRKPSPHLRAILRLATVEMLQEGAPAHGVVGAAVGMARHGKAGPAQAGFVNAVLRKVAETAPEAWAALPPQPLPGWLRGRIESAEGRAVMRAIEAAHAAGAPLDLTPRDGDAAALAAAMGGVALPTGSVRLARSAQVSALPGFAEGAFWVQDAAAALPARLLGPARGTRVLDLCAAPGGKTLQLAAMGAQVTALDISGPRLERLRANLARTGLSAEVICADALQWVPDAPFEAILLDAPCTATGTIRRHPDLPFHRQARDIAPLRTLQAALLDRALGWLAPGGRLVYATCSLLPEEGAGQVRAALERHPGLVVRPAKGLPGVPEAWCDSLGGVRLRPDFWPEQGGLDGFYMAALGFAGGPAPGVTPGVAADGASGGDRGDCQE